MIEMDGDLLQIARFVLGFWLIGALVGIRADWFVRAAAKANFELQGHADPVDVENVPRVATRWAVRSVFAWPLVIAESFYRRGYPLWGLKKELKKAQEQKANAAADGVDGEDGQPGGQ